MTTTYNYGDNTIEFFLFNQNEVDSIIAKLEDNYMASSHSYSNPKGDLAANINLRIGPVAITLPVLLELCSQGYVLRTDRYCSVDATGTLDVTVRKPSAMIQEDIRAIRAVALEQYEAERYKRNAEETERQIAITLERIQREEDARAETAKAKALEKAKAQALADLREAYSE
ncbi:hypothetical protein ACA097_27790 [Pseudomonas sp. QL9]|uniref:hypothetical protein n=1 Tax=Pseudomonas sp. QL9 TaxID=3242725 RepID=UPI00352AF964